MEQNIKMARVIVHVKKIWLNVRFHCKLSFLLKNQYNQTVAQSENSYELLKGQCHINQAIYFESNVNFSHLRPKKMKLIIMMMSANGMVPAGTVTFQMYTKGKGQKIEQIYPLKKCDDQSAKVKFIHLYENYQQLNIGNSYIAQYPKSVLLQKQNSSQTKVGGGPSSNYKSKLGTSPLGRQNSSSYKNKIQTIVAPQLFGSRYGQTGNYEPIQIQREKQSNHSNRSNLSPRYNLAQNNNQNSTYGRSIISSKQKSKDRFHYYEQNAKSNMKASKILVQEGEQFQASRTNLHDNDNKNQEYFRRIVILEQENDDLKNILQQSSMKISQINQECQQYTLTIRQMDRDLCAYKQKFTQMSSLATSISKKSEEKDHEMEQQRLMKKQLNDKNSQLIRIITEKDQKMGQLSISNQELLQSLTLKNSKIEYLQQKIQSYKKSISKSHQQSQQQLNKNLNEFQQELNTKQSQIQDFKLRLKDRQQNIGKLLVARNQLHLQLDQLSQKILLIQESDQEKFKAIYKLNDDIIQEKNSSCNWKKQLQKIKAQLQSKDTQIFQVEQRNDMLQRDLLKARDQVKQFKSLNHNLGEQLKQTVQRLNQQKQQKSHQILQVKKHSQTIIALNNSISVLKQQTESLRQNLEASQQQIQRHKKLNIMMTNKLKTFEAQKSFLNTKIQQQKIRLKRTQSQLKQLSQLSLQKHTSTKKIQEQLSKQQQNFNKLKQQLQFVKDLLNKSNHQNQQQNIIFQTSKLNFDNEITKLQSQIANTLQKLSQKEKEIIKISLEKDQISKKQLYNRKFETKYEDILEEVVIKDQEIKILSEEKKSILLARHKLQEKLNSQNSQILHIKLQVKILQEKLQTEKIAHLEELRVFNQKANAQIKLKSQTIDHLNQNHRAQTLSFTSSINELKQILSSQSNLHQQAIKLLQQNISSLQNQKQEASLKIQAFKASQKILKDEINFLSQMIQKTRDENITNEQKFMKEASTLEVQSKITLQIKQKEVQELNIQLQSLQSDKNKIIIHLESQISGYKTRLAEQEQKNLELQIMLDLNQHNQKEREKLKQKFKELVGQNIKLKNQLKESRNQIQSMRKIELLSETSLQEQVSQKGNLSLSLRKQSQNFEKLQRQNQKRQERSQSQNNEAPTKEQTINEDQSKTKSKKNKKNKNK